MTVSTVPDIIQCLGGPSALARRLSSATGRQHGPSKIGEWKRMRSIPPKYWGDLLRIAKEDGRPITADTLIKAHAETTEKAAG